MSVVAAEFPRPFASRLNSAFGVSFRRVTERHGTCRSQPRVWLEGSVLFRSGALAAGRQAVVAPESLPR